MKKNSFLNHKLFLLFPEHKMLSLAFLGLTITAGALIVITGRTANHESSKSALVVSKLNALQTNIATLQESANKPFPKIDLSSMTQQIQQLSQQLEQVRSQNSDHFNQALNQTEEALAKRLDTIKQIVDQLNKKQDPIKFLPPRNLPFQVLSIDSIQHVPVASIAYDFKTIPLEKDDSLAGWRIVAIDYGKQCIEFENAKKEHVLLTLESIG